MDYYGPPSRNGSYQASTHGRSNSDLVADSGSSKPAASNAAAGGSSSRNRSDSGNKLGAKVPVPQYLTAEQEKAALRRYQEAKEAVGRVQGYVSDEVSDLKSSGSGPIAYDSLYPSPALPSGSSADALNKKGDSPPPFDAASNNMSHLSEKERMRRAYAAQDAAAALQNNQLANDSPPPFSSPISSQGLSEKELLQRKFDAQDAEARRAAAAPRPPPRKVSNSSIGRPTPAAPGAVKVLTALEEKTLLKAKYDAEDTIPKPKVNGNGHGSAVYTNGGGLTSPSSSVSTPSTPPIPPPLMPRPPVEYIQETQEEDARVSRFVTAGVLPPIEEPILLRSNSLSPSSSIARKSGNPGLGLDPFTPFTPGFDSKLPGPPPPLPPKPAE